MAEITNAGYQSIRDFVEATWKYVELRDETGTKIVRLAVRDPRVTWEHNANAQTLELKVVIKGSDAEVSLPKTFASSAIYSIATGGSALSDESFSDFTMESSGDELTVIHKLEIPQII